MHTVIIWIKVDYFDPLKFICFWNKTFSTFHFHALHFFFDFKFFFCQSSHIPYSNCTRTLRNEKLLFFIFFYRGQTDQTNDIITSDLLAKVQHPSLIVKGMASTLVASSLGSKLIQTSFIHSFYKAAHLKQCDPEQCIAWKQTIHLQIKPYVH